jgi:hypothetical protein
VALHDSSDGVAEVVLVCSSDVDLRDSSDAVVVDLVCNDDAVVVQACSGGVEHRGSSDVAVHHGSGDVVVEPQSAELPLDLLVTEPDPYSSWLGLTALSIP